MKLTHREPLLLLVALAAVAAVSELAIRARYGERFAPRPLFTQAHERLGWVPSPGLDDTFFGGDFAMRIETDSHGCRLGARGPTGPDARLIVLLGDSYTFGWGVSSDETFASYLDASLEAEGSDLRIANLGVSGYSTLAYAERLAQVFEGVDPARIQSIFVLHADNDMIDNVNFALFWSGFRAPAIREFQPESSRSHLVNLVRRSWVAWSQGPGIAGGNASDGIRDELFSFPMQWTGKQTGAVRIDGETEVDFRDLRVDEELAHVPTLRRGHLTPFQRALFKAGLRDIQCALPNRGLRIHHGVTDLAFRSPGAQEWYAATIRELLAEISGSEPGEEALICGNHARFVGLLRVPPSEVAEQHNPSSAGHFTPAMNEAVARRVRAIALERGTGAAPAGPRAAGNVIP